MLRGLLWFVWVFALAGCFTDSGGASMSDASSDATKTSGTGVTGSGDECAPLAQLAMTESCVKGLEITSEDWGTARCEEEFGAGWTWIEHHYQGGWDVAGVWMEEASVGLRGWIHVTNQNSECFSTSGTTGVTWVRAACAATCHPGCDPYVGDTPCDQCLGLICVSAI